METKSPFVPILVVVLVGLFALSLAWFVYSEYQAEQALGNTSLSAWHWIGNALLLALPIGLLYFAAGVLLLGYRQHTAGRIRPGMARLLYWTPRIAGILITLFVGMFAFDEFSAGNSLWQTLGFFLMHLVPALIMAGVLAAAWRQEMVGFWAFLLLALYFARLIFSGNFIDFGSLLVFSGPMLLIALLFGANWRWRADLHPALPAV